MVGIRVCRDKIVVILEADPEVFYRAYPTPFCPDTVLPGHRFARTVLPPVLPRESVIPAKAGRPTDKLPKGKWRWLMATNFNAEDYGQRWQVETVMRMIKARQGESLAARSDATRRDELGLMAVTHNVMILLWTKFELFYRASPTPFCPTA